MPLYTSVNLEAVSEALGESASAGQVFKADGAGGGTMTKNTQVIQNSITVGKSGDVDYNTIGAALSYVATQSPSPSNPW